MTASAELRTAAGLLRQRQTDTPIALPLSRALDLLADRWDTHDPHLDAMHQHDETAVGHHLLVIARQINGGGS